MLDQMYRPTYIVSAIPDNLPIFFLFSLTIAVAFGLGKLWLAFSSDSKLLMVDKDKMEFDYSTATPIS